MQRLSTHQFMVLSSAILLGTVFFPIADVTVGAGGRDGWMAVFPGYLTALPLGVMILSLIPKYPNKNLIEITEIVLGKWIGKGLGIFYILISAYMGGLLLTQAVDVFMRTILPLMPRSVLVFAGFIVVFYLYSSGIEVFGRFSEVVFPMVTLALTAIAVFSISRFEQGELFPILANGIWPVFQASLQVIPFSMEYILFLAGLLPFLPKKAKELKQLKKGIWRASLLVSSLLTMITVIQIMTFGPVEAVRLKYGILSLSKMIEISRTIVGVESIFLLVWFGSMVIKVCGFFFSGMWGIQSVLGLKKFWWSFLLASIFIAVPMNFIRSIELINEIDLVDKYIILPFAIFWVLLVWGVDKWKSRLKSQ